MSKFSKNKEVNFRFESVISKFSKNKSAFLKKTGFYVLDSLGV